MLRSDGDKPVIEVKYKGETKRFAPEEISAAVLQKMKQVGATYMESAEDMLLTALTAVYWCRLLSRTWARR